MDPSRLGRVCVGVEGAVDERKGARFVVSEDRIGGRAGEEGFPESAAGGAWRELRGNPLAIGLGEDAETAQTGMQLALEPGAQVSCEDRGSAIGANGDRQVTALDQGAECEGAKVGFVGNVDRDIGVASPRRKTRILGVVFRGAHDQRAAGEVSGRRQALQPGDAAVSKMLAQFVGEGWCGDGDDPCPGEQGAHLCGCQCAAANHERRCPGNIQKDGKGAHGRAQSVAEKGGVGWISSGCGGCMEVA